MVKHLANHTPHWPDSQEHRYKGLFHCCMIYQAVDSALLTVMFFLHNACFHLKRGMCCGPTATQSSRCDASPRWIWFTCGAMCTIHINIQSFLNCGLYDWSQLHIAKPIGYKFRRLKAATRVSMVVGLVCMVLRPLCLCAVYVLQGCPSALCLVWRRGLLCQANHDQLGSPAHKELRSRL